MTPNTCGLLSKVESKTVKSMGTVTANWVFHLTQLHSLDCGQLHWQISTVKLHWNFKLNYLPDVIFNSCKDIKMFHCLMLRSDMFLSFLKEILLSNWSLRSHYCNNAFVLAHSTLQDCLAGLGRCPSETDGWHMHQTSWLHCQWNTSAHLADWECKGRYGSFC